MQNIATSPSGGKQAKDGFGQKKNPIRDANWVSKVLWELLDSNQ